MISSDDHEIGRLAARHLIEAGAKVLACVGSPFPNLQERIRGFREEANDLGLAVPSSRVPSSENIKAEESKFITSRLMNSIPAGWHFYFNDQYALVGLRQLHNLRIDVPGEVKIVGCDNIESTLHCRPTLTTIRQDPMELGHKAFQLLSERLETPVVEPPFEPARPSAGGVGGQEIDRWHLTIRGRGTRARLRRTIYPQQDTSFS